jgi:hypothetical protein
MTANKPAKKAAKAVASGLRDDGECVALMEPMLVAEGSPARRGVVEQAFELSQKAAAFRISCVQ